MRLFKTKQAASTTEMGLLIGLIAVGLILAVRGTGFEIAEILGKAQNAVGNRVTDSGNGGGGDNTPDQGTSCADILQKDSSASNGVYTIVAGPNGGPSDYQAYCEMGLDGGGWTHAMTLNVNSGLNQFFGSSYWTGSSFGSFGARFTGDYKGQAAATLTGNSILIVVREAASDEGSAPLGWRSWNFNSAKTVQSMFNAPVGSHTANSAGGCNSGYAGAGNLQTSGTKASGSCASFNGAQDTFTCTAANLYSNSYYGSCSATGDAFRLSSWYRWANNSNVGLGLQMDGSTEIYNAEAGTHLPPETFTNPQRYCSNGASCQNTFSNGQGPSTNLVPGGDHGTNQNTIGQNWRYEIYVQ